VGRAVSAGAQTPASEGTEARSPEGWVDRRGANGGAQVAPSREAPSRERPEPFEELHFSPAPAIRGPVPGPRSQQMLAEQAALESRARSYPRAVPVAFESGKGATLRDVDGNTYVDFFGGAGTLNVGHGHPAVKRAASEQQERLVHACTSAGRRARTRWRRR
jgi:hypothetical protein